MKKLYPLFILLLITSLSYGQVFITEIADPNDDSSVRYIELYNAGATAVDLSTGWKLEKFLNGATEITTHTVNLTGTIAPNGFYILARGATDTAFFDTFGFAPDQWEGSDALADQPTSNGDDVIQLVNGATLVDIYGVIGTDGTGEAWEFEDGRAARKSTVTSNNTSFTIGEWDIDSDQPSGNGPQDTTDSFDPGVWAGTLSIDSFEQFAIKVFPNPVNNGFVNIESETANDLSIELFDINGRRVLQTNLTSDLLNVTDIKSGLYLLKISSNDKASISKLIIQ